MLRLYFSYISIVLHYLLGRILVFRNNKLSFGKRTIIWKSKIKISGKKNVVQIGQLVNLKNTDITIKGNQNHVFLGDNVKIYEYGKLYFGEITLCHGGGFDRFEPQRVDFELGNKLNI